MIIALALCVCQSVVAQSNPTLVRDRIVKNSNGTASKYNFEIESSAIPTFAHNQEFSNVTGFNTIDISSSPYSFQVLITPNFLGTATFAMEWYTTSNTFPFIEPKVTFYEIDVLESIIDTETDVVTIDASTTSIEIYPVANDYAEFAPLELTNVSHVMYGSAEVTDSNTIIYTPSNGADDYLMYTVTDTIGESASGKIVINILEENPLTVDTLNYTITDIQSQIVVLPFNDLDVVVSPSQGEIDSLSEYAFRYTPNLGASGVDTISLENAVGVSRVVLLEVFPISSEPSYAVDDYYFSAEGTSVTITPTATAKIYVSIGNYSPQSTFAYSFVTPEGQPLVIKYDVPLQEYEFVTPSFNTPHGFVSTYGEDDNVTVGCDDVNGEAFFIYYPSPGYVGNDNFDSDLLPIGRHMGISGSSRESAYDFWSAEDTDDWTYNQPNGKNQKHVDADGDGVVTVADTNSISDYYNQLSNFVPEEVLDIKDYPFYLVPNVTEVDSGDLLVLDIVLGSEDYPVKDLHGLAFAIQVNGTFADSSSLNIDLYEDSWLTFRSKISWRYWRDSRWKQLLHARGWCKNPVFRR